MKKRLHDWLFPAFATQISILWDEIVKLESERDWLRKTLGESFERREAALKNQLLANLPNLRPQTRYWPAYLRNTVGVTDQEDDNAPPDKGHKR